VAFLLVFLAVVAFLLVFLAVVAFLLPVEAFFLAVVAFLLPVEAFLLVVEAFFLVVEALFLAVVAFLLPVEAFFLPFEAFFRAVERRAVEPVPALLRAFVRLLRAFFTCVSSSRTALRASSSRLDVVDLIAFSTAARDVLTRLSAALPPLDRRELAVFLRAVVFRADDERLPALRLVVLRDGAERPLALRVVVLRAVVLRAPPVLRLAVLRAAGDISLLSLMGTVGMFISYGGWQRKRDQPRMSIASARKKLDASSTSLIAMRSSGA
jgi:hypothetical protein